MYSLRMLDYIHINGSADGGLVVVVPIKSRIICFLIQCSIPKYAILESHKMSDLTLVKWFIFLMAYYVGLLDKKIYTHR